MRAEPHRAASESQIQGAILDYLAARRILAFRMNVGVFKVAGRRIAAGVPGMGDVIAFPPNRSVLWVECKSETGKQSALQKSFQAQVEAHGHIYIIARSIDDVRVAIRD